ncbi:MAG: zinc-dependent alcohol dehydrogenase family protein [Lachnospiraceae bacterium]|nr:zinc-dependent alcohol dehydrogenase family protein [Lachnospiraceae bacterium]
MYGNYFLGNGSFEVREIPERELLKDEVLVKVAACGICGTDVHIFHGDKGSAEVNPPVILGHELSGTVEQTGRGVTSVRVGDHVTVDPNIYCGKCHYCKIGKKQQCTGLEAIGVTMNGGFADYCYVPETQCHVLPPQVSLRAGAMAEPLACCLHGTDLAGIRAGDSVCVIGGGAIGLMMVQLAKLSGAASVILSEPVEMRRKIGLDVGADYAVDPLDKPIGKQIEDILSAKGADVVIECAGNTAATKQAFEAADDGGTVLLFSVPKAGSSYSLSLEQVFQKELKIIGSRINPDTHGRAVALINSGKVSFDKLITHSYKIGQLREAIIKQTENDSIKVVIEP